VHMAAAGPSHQNTGSYQVLPQQGHVLSLQGEVTRSMIKSQGLPREDHESTYSEGKVFKI
jgi:hypothetical protein